MKKNGTKKIRIIAGIGEDMLQEIFGGKPFMGVLKEAVKNSRDWGADKIYIETQDKAYLKIVDNGQGMNAENRNAFFSVNKSTAKSAEQSGKFCTGIKHLLYSHAEGISILTAPEEDPEYVIRFSCKTKEHGKVVFSHGKIEIPGEKIKKDKSSWPYEFLFGTEIICKLSDPDSKDIKRGRQLAEDLSAQLPLKFSNHILVDGEYIPAKKIVGRMFTYAQYHRQLGEVVMEIYNPEEKAHKEGLLLGSVEVGEVPIVNLNKLLSRNTGMEINPLFLQRDVCGTIRVPFLKNYANEDRFTLKSGIVDDPHLAHLLALLNEIAEEVSETVGIRLSQSAGADKNVINEVTSLFNRQYAKITPPANGPEKATEEDMSPPIPGEKKEDPKKPIKLSLERKEYEPGDEINVFLHLRKDFLDKHDPDKIKWDFSRSLSYGQKKTGKGYKMTAEKVGQGIIKADVPGTPLYAEADYVVVKERFLKMKNPSVRIEVSKGEVEYTITALNTDKIKGELLWKHSGIGSIDTRGSIAIFSSYMTGHATVTAYDSLDPENEAICDITVTRKRDLICIRGYWFASEHLILPSGKEPVSMILGSDVHTIMYNLNAPGAKEAKERGALLLYIAQAIAYEFAFFRRFHLKEVDLGQANPGELKFQVEEIKKEAYEIIGEVLK